MILWTPDLFLGSLKEKEAGRVYYGYAARYNSCNISPYEQKKQKTKTE